MPTVVSVGKGRVANGGLTLRDRCEPGLNCDLRRLHSTWRVGEGQLSFSADGVEPPADCLEVDGWTVLDIPIVDEGGATDTLTVHGQRVVKAAGIQVAVPLNDQTPWLDSPDLQQSLHL